ncbi:hypothetical protein AAFC00_000644 [Neodothiora populina]|uniref:LCCL domain-containing protein n=1 Tax=Neodothiora populina TaxID=2781224 RepID=A0ABR3PDL9_9PEZI
MSRGHDGSTDEPERYHDDEDASDQDTLLPPDSIEQLPPPSASSQSIQFNVEQPKQHTILASMARLLPERVKTTSSAIVTWVKGPQPPRIYKIRPIFPAVQHTPIRLLDRYAPKRMQRFWLLIFWYFLWILSFSLMLHRSSFASDVKGYGSPVRLGCTASFWGRGNDCGINGDQCRPFANASFPFRCPAGCIKVQALNPHAVGDQEVVYKPLVVGGPPKENDDNDDNTLSNHYRGDSFICAAAIHSGFIKSEQGGCGVVELVGDQHYFPNSKHNDIESVEFDSYFPQSFSFKPGTQAQCKDLRWPLLVISVFFTSILSLFTTSPAVFFWSVFVGLFFQTGLASDPPNMTNYYSLISTALGRFLPAAFVMAIIYRYCVIYQLSGLTAQVEKTVLWLGAAWVGALNNYTFDRIPIQRLTPHDIKAQPGAIPALITVVLSIFFIALGQAYAFRVEGRMPRYLVVYGIFVLGILAMVAIPRMNVRIHHYILAILLLPGTAFQNRPSLLYQGLLVGLFINGIARWGFDSILQTPAELLGDAQQGTLLPHVPAPIIGQHNITFTLGPFPPEDKHGNVYDGISILVNDVERFRGYRDWDGDLWHDGQREWTWNRHRDPGAPKDADLPEYFRFAYMDGNHVADYTKAGKWDVDNSWIPMASGPSK